MRTIIHIGQHKTGTTSIQHFLQNKRVEMLDRGLYVPESLLGEDNPSHYLLNVYALDENRYSSMKERLILEKPGDFFENLQNTLKSDVSRHYLRAQNHSCNDVIWSNEGLYLLNSVREYRRLRELFEDFSSTVACVCCFRDVESYRKSYAVQIQKTGGLVNDVDSFRYLGRDSWLLDYSRKIELLKNVFDQVITFDYNERDNVGEFFEKIGYPVEGLNFPRLNVTEYK